MSWRRPSQNTFGMWTVLYWTRSSRTCNFLYCNHQVHRDFFITLYVRIYIFSLMRVTYSIRLKIPEAPSSCNCLRSACAAFTFCYTIDFSSHSSQNSELWAQFTSSVVKPQVKMNRPSVLLSNDGSIIFSLRKYVLFPAFIYTILRNSLLKVTLCRVSTAQKVYYSFEST
jgi:hypothetical protein